MKFRTYGTCAAALLIATSLPLSTAHAQLGDMLKGGGNGSTGGGLGSLGGSLGGMSGALPGQSMTSGSLGNVAGVLQYCIKNNYLGGNSASTVKDSLMSKLSGSSSNGSPTSDSGYVNGAKGILDSGTGKQVDLSGGGLKEQITKQICDRILAQGKSMLGMGR